MSEESKITAHAKTGVVDQVLQRVQLADAQLHPGQRRGVSQVSRQDLHSGGMGRAQFSRQALQAVGAPGHQDQIAAAGRQGTGKSGAQTGRGAGHQGKRAITQSIHSPGRDEFSKAIMPYVAD